MANARSELERHIIMRGRRAGKSTLSADMQSLEDMILEDQARQMEEAINFDILADILCNGFGWTLVEVWHNEWAEVDAWLEKNSKCEYKRNGYKILFEDDHDAMWCKMRWL